MEPRLEELEKHANTTETRLLVIEKVQSEHGDKLDRIVNAVTRYDSRPVFDLHKAISITRDIFAICAVLGGLAVWLILTLTAANDKLTAVQTEYLEKKITKIEAQFSWRALTEATK